MSNHYKYLEGDYSKDKTNVKRLLEACEDYNQALELQEIETKLEGFLYRREKDKKKHEYLVEGANLTCNSCTTQDVTIDGIKYTTPSNSYYKGIKVTNNNKAKNNSGQLFATVKDCIKAKNIGSFGNCKNLPDRTEEMDQFKKIKNSGTQILRENGTCQYLMKLSNEWENMVTNTKYESFQDVEDGDRLEGLTMESVLFCKHGGFIYPMDSGQEENELLVTQQQLIDCGWNNVSQEEAVAFSNALKIYKITSPDSIKLLIATMLSETKCSQAIEHKDSMTDAEWKTYKAAVKKATGVTVNYNKGERGAGYIQITGRDVQLKFLETMKDSYKGTETAEHIGKKYPIEASVWYWTKVQKTSAGNLNAYAETYGSNERIFLITQYFVNGYKGGIDAYLGKIREGKISYDDSNGKLKVDGKTFDLPVHWEDRKNIWKKVEGSLE